MAVGTSVSVTIDIVIGHAVLSSLLQGLARAAKSSCLGCRSLASQSTVTSIRRSRLLHGPILLCGVGVRLWRHIVLHTLSLWRTVCHTRCRLLLGLLLLILNHIWPRTHQIWNTSSILGKSLIIQVTISSFLSSRLPLCSERGHP